MLYQGPIVKRVDADGVTYASPYEGDPRIGSIICGPPQSDAGKVILWIPGGTSDPRLTKIADHPSEPLSIASRDRFANAMGVNLQDGAGRDLIAELLMDHGRRDGRGHYGIRGCPSVERLAYEIHLGELGRIWSQPVPPCPHSQRYFEGWPTNGAVTSGQNRGWTVTAGTPVVSGNTYTGTGATGLDNGAVSTSLLDTVNQRHMAVWTAADFDATFAIKVRDQGQDNDNFYAAQGRHFSGSFQRFLRKRVGASNTTFYIDATDPGASGVARIDVDGATITGWWGAFTSGPQTDASPQLLTNFAVQVTLGALDVTGDVTLDNNEWSDIVRRLSPLRLRPHPFAPGLAR